ncbi:MAG: nucleotidyltransferase domain-containing protein [Thermoguttaceae bacterium]|jgi:predicted nucleotidyltransferase|nr:nucleotidyltransferase domain-containing protein [Thermoguttaceae bacterium]
MPDPEHSLRKLQPDFQISPGTQVVVKVAKALPGGDGHKPAGSVGVVIEAPPSNRQPYLVRFADGAVVKAHFDELSLRRREVDDVLGEVDEDLLPYVIYRCQVGSKAFGLASEDSDDDLRGIYLPPARLHWSLRRLPEQLELQAGDRDEVYWELEKFLRLALKANPNFLETLWTPMVLDVDETAEELRQIRQAFLSKHVYKTYSGYVLSQFRRMANAYERKGAYKAKHAMHLIRLLHSGIAALQTGEIRVEVGEHREELLEIKAGGLSFDKVKQRALDLDGRFQEAFERTTLPEQPDFARVDRFLCAARRRMVDA